MSRTTLRPAMKPHHQADLRFMLGVLLALAVLVTFILSIHCSI